MTQVCVLRSYDQLSVKHEQLALMNPQFEVPLPPLQPAVFPPDFRELPPPQLELFDLDEVFSSEKVRLAQVSAVNTSTTIMHISCMNILEHT